MTKGLPELIARWRERAHLSDGSLKQGEGWMVLNDCANEAEVAYTRAILHFTVKGYEAGENTDAKHWRQRAEDAEQALAALREAANEQAPPPTFSTWTVGVGGTPPPSAPSGASGWMAQEGAAAVASPPAARLRELACSAAFDEHSYYFQGSVTMLPPTDKHGHMLDFDTCSHPDCLLVRETVAASPPATTEQRPLDYCRSCDHTHLVGSPCWFAASPPETEPALRNEVEEMDKIPEFHETDAEWEASEGAGCSEYDGMKRQYDAILAREAAPALQMRAMLQRVADFNFMETLDASPNPKAREAYTQLMVDVRLMLAAHGSPLAGRDKET